MKDSILMTGVVLSSSPAGENDRRLVLLTKEAGRITVFANGSRKPTSPLAAYTRPFTFAKFSLCPGKDSYHLKSAEMVESFDGISSDYDALTYGAYILELAGYFTEENMQAPQEVDLIYLTVKALIKKKMPPELIRAVYELRMLTLQGIAPLTGECTVCKKKITAGYFLPSAHGMCCKECIGNEPSIIYLNEAACYAFEYVKTTDALRLYSFSLDEAPRKAFCDAMKQYYAKHIGRKFKSLEMIG